MKTNPHLSQNRRLIIGRALAAGAAGLVPVPWVDEFLAGAVRAALIRKLAEIRGVDLDANAVDALAHPHGSRVLGAATFGAIALSTTRRAFRKVATSLLVVRRSDEAIQTYIVGTLFDHYAARHHVGAGLDGTRATAVRRAMDLASKRARNQLAERAFRGAMDAASRVVTKMPRSWAPARSAGRVAMPSVFGAPAADFVPADMVPPLEAKLESAGYFDSLVSAFDESWIAIGKAPEKSG